MHVGCVVPFSLLDLSIYHWNCKHSNTYVYVEKLHLLIILFADISLPCVRLERK